MKTEIVKFYDDEILASIDKNGRQYVAVRTIANLIGLHADSALTGIKNDEILCELLVEYRGTGADGKQYMMQFLPIDHVNGWLFSIALNKVSLSIRPKLTLYKRECFKALNEYFNGSMARLKNNITEIHHINIEMEQNKTKIEAFKQRNKDLADRKMQIEYDNSNQLNLFNFAVLDAKSIMKMMSDN
jgi:hypothetical protein